MSRGAERTDRGQESLTKRVAASRGRHSGRWQLCNSQQCAVGSATTALRVTACRAQRGVASRLLAALLPRDPCADAGAPLAGRLAEGAGVVRAAVVLRRRPALPSVLPWRQMHGSGGGKGAGGGTGAAAAGRGAAGADVGQHGGLQALHGDAPLRLILQRQSPGPSGGRQDRSASCKKGGRRGEEGRLSGLSQRFIEPSISLPVGQAPSFPTNQGQ